MGGINLWSTFSRTILATPLIDRKHSMPNAPRTTLQWVQTSPMGEYVPITPEEAMNFLRKGVKPLFTGTVYELMKGKPLPEGQVDGSGKVEMYLKYGKKHLWTEEPGTNAEFPSVLFAEEKAKEEKK